MCNSCVIKVVNYLHRTNNQLGIKAGAICFVSFTQGSGLALLEEKRKAVCDSRVICSN